MLLMAKAAHDDTQLYYGGIGWLQLQMGYPDGPGGRRTIMHYITRLEAAGYVVRTNKRQGKRVIYELRLPAGFGR
jgi:DNA-binding transcriptional ArsR family regulator